MNPEESKVQCPHCSCSYSPSYLGKHKRKSHPQLKKQPQNSYKCDRCNSLINGTKKSRHMKTQKCQRLKKKTINNEQDEEQNPQKYILPEFNEFNIPLIVEQRTNYFYEEEERNNFLPFSSIQFDKEHNPFHNEDESEGKIEILKPHSQGQIEIAKKRCFLFQTVSPIRKFIMFKKESFAS